MRIENIGQLRAAIASLPDEVQILATAESCCTPIGDIYFTRDGTLLVDVDADPGGQYKEFFMSGRLNPMKRIEPPLEERKIFPPQF